MGNSLEFCETHGPIREKNVREALENRWVAKINKSFYRSRWLTDPVADKRISRLLELGCWQRML